MILTIDVLFEKIAEVADKCDFSTVVVTEIADFLPGIKKVLGKALKKIPTAEVTPPQGQEDRALHGGHQGHAAPTRSMVKRDLDDMIFLMYTGGTTGPAKGAMLTHRSVHVNRLQMS